MSNETHLQDYRIDTLKIDTIRLCVDKIIIEEHTTKLKVEIFPQNLEVIDRIVFVAGDKNFTYTKDKETGG